MPFKKTGEATATGKPFTVKPAGEPKKEKESLVSEPIQLPKPPPPGGPVK